MRALWKSVQQLLHHRVFMPGATGKIEKNRSFTMNAAFSIRFPLEIYGSADILLLTRSAQNLHVNDVNVM